MNRSLNISCIAMTWQSNASSLKIILIIIELASSCSRISFSCFIILDEQHGISSPIKQTMLFNLFLVHIVLLISLWLSFLWYHLNNLRWISLPKLAHLLFYLLEWGKCGFQRLWYFIFISVLIFYYDLLFLILRLLVFGLTRWHV